MYLARVCIIFVIWAHTPLAVWVYMGPYVSSESMYNICYVGPHATSGMRISGPWYGYIWAHLYLVCVCIISVIWAHMPLVVWVYMGPSVPGAGMYNICYMGPCAPS